MSQSVSGLRIIRRKGAYAPSAVRVLFLVLFAAAAPAFAQTATPAPADSCHQVVSANPFGIVVKWFNVESSESSRRESRSADRRRISASSIRRTDGHAAVVPAADRPGRVLSGRPRRARLQLPARSQAERE